MDQGPTPTAAELGITELEYERILRGLGASGTSGVPAPPVVRRPRRSSGFAVPAVASLLAVVLLVLRLGSDDAAPAYAFLHEVGGSAIAYSSCKQLRVEVYPDGGPADAEQLVHEAVAQLRAASGLDIVISGVFGGHAPNWNFEAAPVEPGDPVSVSWQNGAAIARLTEDVAGLGGSRIFTSPYGSQFLAAGTIALSKEYYTRGRASRDHDEALSVLLHEFGHVLGLNHVDSGREVMHPRSHGQPVLGPGDREGLRLLGQGPCA